VKDAPKPRRRPATGSMAIGSMKLRPTRCKTLKILSFTIKTSYKKIIIEAKFLSIKK
jgi:hypothetical protein